MAENYLEKDILDMIANTEGDTIWMLQTHIKMLIKHIKWQEQRITELQETGTKLIIENRELKNGKIL